MNIILVLITIFLFSFLFLQIGISFNNSNLFKEKTNKALIYSTAYFSGMAIFLSIWRIICYSINDLVLSLLVTIVVGLVIIYYYGKKIIKDSLIEVLQFSCKIKFYIMSLTILVFTFLLVYWMFPFAELSPKTLIGSLHSPRYANLATYFLDNNRIPILNQNYGQSMLASIPMIYGFDRPLLALYIWLSITMIHFIFLLYGLFRFLDLRKIAAVLGTLVVLFGNTAFSIIHVLIIDSGSPFVCNGYTDSIASVGTFIFFIFWLETIYTSRNSFKIQTKDIFTFFTLAIYWNMSSPQNIIISLMILFLLILMDFVKNHRITNYSIVKLSSFFIVFNLMGISVGGMLTPNSLKDDVYIPGIMEIKEKTSIQISPGIAYFIGNAGRWDFGDNLTNINKGIMDAKNSITIEPIRSIIKILFFLELIVLITIKIIFWPFLGIVGLYVLKSNYISKNNIFRIPEISTKYRALFYIGLMTFILGFIVSFLFDISGYKWELSRFIILGYFFGLICLVLVFNKLINEKIISTKIYFIAIFFILIGPFVNIGLIIAKNLFYTNHSLSFMERLNILMNKSGIIN